MKEEPQYSTIYKASKAILDDYYRMESTPEGAVPPLVNYEPLKAYVLADEEIRGFIGSIVDALTASGYRLTGSKSYIKKDEQRLKDIKFYRHIKKIYYNAIGFNNVFIELISNKLKSKIVDLRVLPSDKIKPILSKHQELKGYTMDNPLGGKPIMWDKDEIVHISIDHITDSFWTYPILKTLERFIKLKAEVIQHIYWLFQTNQYRTHFHATNVNKNDIEVLTDLFREGMSQKEQFLITVGKEPMEGKQIANPKDLENYIDLLNKIRNMMLSLIRLPPIIAGTVDNSNRSNSDVQARFAFLNRLKSIQRDIEDELNNELFPKIGVKSEIRHNTIDIKSDKELVEIATLLMNAGADKKKINTWLNDRGLDLPVDLFDNIVEQDFNGVKLDKNSNMHPSRKPQDNFGKSDYGTKEVGNND